MDFRRVAHGEELVKTIEKAAIESSDNNFLFSRLKSVAIDGIAKCRPQINTQRLSIHCKPCVRGLKTLGLFSVSPIFRRGTTELEMFNLVHFNEQG
jgi:hypothetical protein